MRLIILLIFITLTACANNLDSPFNIANPLDVFNANEVRQSEKEPDLNAKNLKKVNGVVSKIELVERRPSSIKMTGVPIIDAVEYLSATNFNGFPLYYIKINKEITLEIGSRKPFRVGECVLVWYDQEMGDQPSLSIPGQAGISKDEGCDD